MILFLCGDIHGNIVKFYDDILAVEKNLGFEADWVLQTGNFGIWPDPARIDRATRNHGGAGCLLYTSDAADEN